MLDRKAQANATDCVPSMLDGDEPRPQVHNNYRPKAHQRPDGDRPTAIYHANAEG
jgi:hypothetical protein